MLLSGQLRPPKARPWSSCSGLRAGRWHTVCPWGACPPPPAGAPGPSPGTRASSTQPDSGTHRQHGGEGAKQTSHTAKLGMPPVQRQEQQGQQEQQQRQQQRQRRWQQPRAPTSTRAAAGAEQQQAQARPSALRSLVAKITGAGAAAERATGSDAERATGADASGAAGAAAVSAPAEPSMQSVVSAAERAPGPAVVSAAAGTATGLAATEPARPGGSDAQQEVVSQPAKQAAAGGGQQPQARPSALRSLVAKITGAGSAAERATGSAAEQGAAGPAAPDIAAAVSTAGGPPDLAAGSAAEVAAEPGGQAPLPSPTPLAPAAASSSQPAAAAGTAAVPPAAVVGAQQKPPASSPPAPLASSIQVAAPAQQLTQPGAASDVKPAASKQPPVGAGSAAGKAGGVATSTGSKAALQPRATRAGARQPRVRWQGRRQSLSQQPADKDKQGTGSAAVPTGSGDTAAGQEESRGLATAAAAVGAAALASRQLPHPSQLASPEALRLLRTLGVAEGQLQSVVGAAHAALKDHSVLLSEEDVRQACSFLVDELKLSVSKVPVVLEGAPEVLGVGLDELRRRITLLSTLWCGRTSTLLRSLQAQPELLTQAFFAQLGVCLEALVSLGFNREQACRAVAKCPRIVHRRRYELASALHKAGFKLEGAQKSLFDFLAAHPQLMMPGGTDELQALVALLADFGLQPDEAAATVAACPALMRTSHNHMRSVVNLLRSSGFRQADVAAVLRGFPRVLVSDLPRVRSVLLLMRTAGVPLAAVVNYPRIFYHHPANCIAPRLAYLKAHKPGRMESLALVSIMSRSDSEFAETKGQIPLEEYLVFKDRWLSLYGHRLGLTPAAPRKQELRRQLAKEVAGQLFSPIDWDNV